MNKRFKITGIILIALLIIIFIFVKASKKEAGKITIETAPVTISTVTNTVTATGTIEAIKTVAVGTQVSGVISKIYADFNSKVKKGQLLAEIDKAPLLTSLESAQASMDDATAELNFQKANYDRIKALFDKKLVAETDYEQALYNYQKASASLKIARSNYDKAKVNLNYASITSPIDGVVLNRAVDEGQTVAASFNTPTLFSIAHDLTQMEVQANIDEADIGQVNMGQKVDFTVDAYPDMKFKGEVTEIRLQPTTTSNVVTYTVIVKAPNPDQKLMPGMTASITIITEQADNVVTVPGKALRFKPDMDVLQTYYKTLPENERPKETAEVASKPKSAGSNGFNRNKQGNTGDTSSNPSVSEVWVKQGNLIHPVKVTIGINDGNMAEVKSGLKEGDEVVTAINAPSAASKGNEGKEARSPFMPQRPQQKKR